MRTFTLLLALLSAMESACVVSDVCAPVCEETSCTDGVLSSCVQSDPPCSGRRAITSQCSGGCNAAGTGCFESSVDSGPSDAGSTPDSGSIADAGSIPDAGTNSDAGSRDAGVPIDGGSTIGCNPATVAEFAGTCLASAFSCFTPQGTCTSVTQIGTDTFATTYTWNNGTQILEGGGPDAPFSLQVAGPGGPSCVSVEAFHGGTSTCAAGASGFSVLNDSSQSVATICWNTSGPSVVKCANGTSLTLDNDAMNRVADCLPVAPAIALCTPETACPVGDAGPSSSCCQPNGNSCAAGSDCCSENCIIRGGSSYCCEPGGCP